MDYRREIFNTHEYSGFKPCPFCGSKDQSAREWKSSWGDGVSFTLAFCCNRCGLQFPIEVALGKMTDRGWFADILGHLDEIKQRWNTRWSNGDD